MSKIYLAAPFSTLVCKHTAERAKEILEEKGFEVYAPWEHKIVHAWDYPNSEWGLMVFNNDINAINESDYTVVLSYGRLSTAGTNWEAGYSFGIGHKVIVVEVSITGVNVMSLMVANGRYATVKGLDGLENYDFNTLPMTRTDTEVK